MGLDNRGSRFFAWYSMNISNGPAIVSLIGIATYIAAFAKLYMKRADKNILTTN